MSIKLENYLFFSGNCAEAMEYYQSVFGGELTKTTRGSVDPKAPENMKDLLIHCDLSGGLIHLMASDDIGIKNTPDPRISMSLNGEHSDDATLRRVYDQLACGNPNDHPIKTEFWGDTFGDVTDKYSIRWLVNIAAAPKSE